ncbi:chemotaxis protein CheB [Lewinella sp. IMCC34183]|uniref:chemotaxis protein CheB n=1 Tax=Lewinella sp. IMCC34183 TaxID=2248762 RepID=UPI000E2265D3|nr:chemotaxis protein CheB [Lewinella sp. IMCC34183]
MAVRIVGIGASAGGIPALEAFFSAVPSDLGLAYVVVQHLSLDHISSMASILQRTTNLKVVSLNTVVVPEPDTVYVKMPEVDVRVEDHALTVTQRTQDRDAAYLPIDDFLFSLAQSRTEDAIAIILSGMGTDGSRGLQEIKSHGGIVMVQHPDSAQFDGMPRAALRQHLADIVLPPAELARRLALLVRSRTEPEETGSLDELTQSEIIRTLLNRVKKISFIDFNRYRPATIMRRIEKRMLVSSYDDLRDYIDYALENEEELLTLRQSFLIGVTRFYRDPEAFALLRTQVIPQIFAKDEAEDIRIWVPACSTGEEVYSIAILIKEYLRENELDRSFKIFGSDVDRNAIIKAASGLYDDNIVADVPMDLLQRYFIHTNAGFRVRDDVKESILFAVQNLLQDPPFIRIDFVSCRNFLIYVNGEAQQRILGDFYFSLNANGTMMLGPSESLGGLQSAFSTVNRRWKVYRKRTGNKDIPTKVIPHSLDTGVARNLGLTIVPPESTDFQDELPSARPLPVSTKSTMDYYARFLSERFAPATLFVNKQYEILYLSGDFSGILRLPRFNAHLSLHTVVSEQAQSLLITGVDRVLRTGKSGQFERINVSETPDNPQWVRVRFSLQEFVELDQAVAMLEFFSNEETESGSGYSPGVDDEVFSVDRQLKDKIRDLESELLRSQQRAQKLYTELEATNEELQASNRELLASNEEMQSTNEELQSVNEELYTVNNEFQRKNEELNEINNDVNNLLKSTQISTIFVDSKLRIRRFTPGVGKQFDLHASDLGRPITSFSNPFSNVDIEKICHQVLEENARHDQEVQDRHGNYFLLRMLPYLANQDKLEGVVITFVDINDLVQTRRRLTDMARKYESIFQNTEELIVMVRENSRIEEINHALGGRSREELIGSYFTDLIASNQDKVKFSEGLRTTFQEMEVTTIKTMVIGKGEEKFYLKVEIIPILIESDQAGIMRDVEQATIIIHDVTRFEVERQASTRVIDQYKRALGYLPQDAGMLDMEERMVLVNHMPTHTRQPDAYSNRKLQDFVSEEGLKRYREAVERLRQGSVVEEVDFREEDLIDDAHPRKVLYRPIYINGTMHYVTFEVVTPPAGG